MLYKNKKLFLTGLCIFISLCCICAVFLYLHHKLIIFQEKFIGDRKKNPIKIAIHTVFILKENILFLEEWIDYHIKLGFNRFYLYDNSKVVKSGGCHDPDPKQRKKHGCGSEKNGFEAGKVNKYNVNYDKIVNMTEKQMQDYVKKICNKYKCIKIIEWSPKNSKGIILHNQSDAHNHCLKLLKNDQVDWCANIDMDEFIIIKDNKSIQDYIKSLPSSISNIKLGQIRFDSRFNNLDKPILSINKGEVNERPRNHSNKNIYKVKNTEYLDVHKWYGNFNEYLPPLNEIWFNHYKMNLGNNFKIINNIHPKYLPH